MGFYSWSRSYLGPAYAQIAEASTSFPVPPEGPDSGRRVSPLCVSDPSRGARSGVPRPTPLWRGRSMCGCLTKQLAAVVSAGLGRPPPSFCNILTAKAMSESMASTSPQPHRHWLRICIWSWLGSQSGPASSKAERSIRSCKAVSPPTRPVKTVRPSLMMAITSDADCVWSPPGGGSYYRVGGTAGLRLGGVGVAPHAPTRPLPLRPGEG